MSGEGSSHQEAHGEGIAQASHGSIAIVGDNNVIQARPYRPPLHKPPQAQHFTDREEELKQLLAGLHPGQVFTLTGPGGIGKSALAAQAVWTLAPDDTPPARFPDGIFFHSFYNQPQTDLALEAIAMAFGEETKPSPETAARRALSGRTALLVFDGAEDAENLRAVQAVVGQCGVLVTSRKHGDAINDWQEIERLPTSEAVKLLRAWGKRQAHDTTAAEQICDLIDGLPLAVRLVGRYLNQTGESANEYLKWLQETPMDALDQGDRRQESVPLLLERSLAQVSEQARQVLAVAGLLALAPFTPDVIAAGLTVETKEIRRPLGELINFGLLHRSEQEYEISHALVRAYARTKTNPRNQTTEQLLRYFIHYVEKQSKLGSAGFQQLDQIRPHIMTILTLGCQQELWEPVLELAFICSHADSYFSLQGHWTQQSEIVETGLQATRELGRQQQEVAFIAYRGQIYHSRQDYEQAIDQYKQALDLAREIGFQLGEGNTLADLGRAYRRLGKPEQAITYHRQALEIKRQLGDRKAEGNSLGNLGNAYHDLGDFKQALHYFEAALAVSRELDDRRGETVRLGNIGAVYHDLGQLELAIEYTEGALGVAREIGDRHSEATWLANLGRFYEKSERLTEARDYLEQAIKLFETISTPDAENARQQLAELG
ncbi:MAG: tetratricopeptide repeat protein [Anaerolineae bacterium]|nr:tetratricopeptide repeat protein [Anaerolineae bacterium]